MMPTSERHSRWIPVLVMIGSLGVVFGLGYLAWQNWLSNATPIDVPTENTNAVRRPDDPALTAVGDISSCGNEHDSETAALVQGLPGPVLVLGDSVYDRGTAKEYAECYDPTWGQFKDRTYPVPGNHEYATKDASGYFEYFGNVAGDPTKGYYSYEVGDWHVIALNSNCQYVGGCAADSPQGQWLTRDLQQHPSKCTLAYMHHPVFSSAFHGNTQAVQPFWKILTANHVDLVLSGHDHDYERFGKLDSDGQPASTGTRLMVVGTGGRSLYGFRSRQPGSEIRNSTAYGVLRLTLRADSYDWNFLSAGPTTFSDQGSSTCD